MKIRIRMLAALLLLVSTVVSSVLAQSSATAPSAYMVVGYHKPLPGKGADYVRLEREQWKAIHQASVKAGNIISWKLYAVSYPNGESLEYEYVTVTVYPSWAALENPYKGLRFADVLGEAKANAIRSATSAARKMLRAETLSLAYATDNFLKSDHSVLSVHFLKANPGRADDFLRVQRDYYLPMNSEVSKANQGASGWASTVLRVPYIADYPYTHVSFNSHASLTQMDTGPSAEIRQKWNAKFREISAMQNESRKRVRNELWRLVDQTQPK